jgi:RHS repeat-associated protein
MGIRLCNRRAPSCSLHPLRLALRIASSAVLASVACRAPEPAVTSSAEALTTSSNSSNFNGTSIAGGNWLWATSVVKVTASTLPVHIYFTAGQLQFTANGIAYTIPVPAAELTIDPNATQATTTFDTPSGMWLTTAPKSFAGNAFITGVAWQVPVNLPGGIHPVTWSGSFEADASVSLNWQWAAAVYSQFAVDGNGLEVKPVDDNHVSVYQNSGHAGTPEAYKSSVIGGATGGGGSNYTGSYSGTLSVMPQQPCSNVTCTAPDSCHVSTCKVMTGLCSTAAVTNGTACTSSNHCLSNTTCQSGVCSGTSLVCPPAADSCHLQASCDPSTGQCPAQAPAPDGTACNDGKACTTGDACHSGVCAGTVNCPAQGQCHLAGSCDATGACTNPLAQDGSACDDNNACSQTDACLSGSCIGSNPVVCTASDQCHAAGACDPSSGACSNPIAVNGTACNDNNACTQTDSCQNGTCTGSNPVTCGPPGICQLAGTCSPSSGSCNYPSKAAGTVCGGAPCTGLERCDGQGTCLPPALPNPGPIVITSTPATVAFLGSSYGYAANARDPDGDPVSYALLAGPSGMTLTASTGATRWTPVALGSSTVAIGAADLDGFCAIQRFTLTVQNANVAPIALPDAYAIDENRALSVPAAQGVLANDTDPGGLALSASIVTPPSSGALDLAPSGAFGYVPRPGFVGRDTFTYVANDGAHTSNPATVTITVRSVNTAPIAADDSYATSGGAALMVSATNGVLANDLDLDGDMLLAVLLSLPSHGVLTFAPDGSFTYAPAAGFTGLDSFTYEATDGQFDSMPATVRIAVDLVNHPPTFVSTPVTAATEGAPYTYQAVATDPDPGDTLTYALRSAPAGMWIDAATGLIAWVPEQAQVGPNSVVVQSTDQGGLLAAQAFVVQVAPLPNHPPAISSTPVLTAEVLTPYTYAIVATDPDPGDSVTLSLVAGPLGASLTGATLSWTPSAAELGPETFTIQATDQHGASVQQAFTVEVQSFFPPAIISTPPSTAIVGQPFNYTLTALVPSLDDVVWNVTLAPPGGASIVVVNQNQARLRWTPSAALVGTQTIGVSVTALGGTGNATANQTFTVNVTTAGIISTPPLTAIENQQYSYVVRAVTRGQGATFTLLTAPPGMTILNVPNLGGVIRWTPTFADLTAEPLVDVAVSDAGGIYGTQAYEIAVTFAPSAPTIVSTPITTALVDQPYVYHFIANDLSGALLSYALPTAPVGMGINPYGVLFWEPAGTQTGPNPVTVKVTNPSGRFSTQSFVVTVLGGAGQSTPPTIISTPVTAATAGQLYTYGVVANDPDPRGTYACGLAIAPAGMSVNPGSCLISWTPSVAQVGTHNVTVNVVDSAGLSATQSFSVTVAAANQPPAISSTPPTRVVAGQAYVYRILASDPDGDALTYALIAGPSGMSVDEGTASVLWIPSSGQTGTFPVEVQVSDPAGLNATQSFSLTVESTEVPPTIVSNPPTTADDAHPYAYQVVAVDSNAQDTLHYSLLDAQTGMAISAAGLVSWAPSRAEIGANAVTIAVTDGAGNTATQSFTITVTHFDSAPVIVSAPPTNATADTLYTYAVLASDADGDALHFTFSGPLGMKLSNAGVLTWTPGDSDVGAVPVSVTVADPAGLSATQNWTITVAPSGLPPSPETLAPPLDPSRLTGFQELTAFLYSGPTPIQTGVAAGTIDRHRAAVLRGRVLGQNLAPLPGVALSVLGHPEFGQTLSRADGYFDLAVNGGGDLVVAYAKATYVPVQRTVNAPWRDFALLPDVVLTPYDSAVTAISFPSAVSIQVVRGNVVTDALGSRQTTLLFMPGTQAEMDLPNGTRTALLSGSIRATELTTGARPDLALPAFSNAQSIPPYSAALTADEAIAAGATAIHFDPPVVAYVENVLGFATGDAIPVSHYDPTTAAWLPDPNGLNLRILGTGADGLAALDLDGSGLEATAAARDAAGISDLERAELAILYLPGTSLRRAPLSHFTDLTFGPVNLCKVRSIFCPGAGVPAPVGDVDAINTCKAPNHSIIDIQNRVLGEEIPIVGTPFTLSYRSNRTPPTGRVAAYTLTIPLSNATIPADVTSIELDVRIAGNEFQQSFAPAPNLETTFTWDGNDIYGRRLNGKHPATVNVGFGYPGAYQAPAGSSNPPPAPKVVIWQSSTTRNVGTFDALAQGFGGLTLSPHHAYDADGQTLYYGDGDDRSAAGTLWNSELRTVAGTGVAQSAGDGGQAALAALNGPVGITIDAVGNLYVAEFNGNRVRKIATDGTITTVAGTGQRGFSGDGGAATTAMLNGPEGVAIDRAGNLYIADTNNQRIRRVSAGTITTVAGNGTAGFGGDAAVGVLTSLNDPTAIAVDDQGNVFIADTRNNRIRKLFAPSAASSGGLLLTVAGGGPNPLPDFQGYALSAQLNNPLGIALDVAGNIYIADSNNLRVRKVDLQQNITTVAGGGSPSDSLGDGGPATSAQLIAPTTVMVDRNGNLYISEDADGAPGRSRIRKVTPAGTISTLAGLDQNGFGGEAGLPAAATLNHPLLGAVDPDGKVYVADSHNNIVRVIAGHLPIFNATECDVASEDGTQLYRFDANGVHQATFDALLGFTVYTFSYDPNHWLTSITDRDGNITTIQRDANENPTAIVGPYGQSTALQVDSAGRLRTITDPAGELVQLAQGLSTGLLGAYVSPRSFTSSITYDAQGLLVRDTDPVGGFAALSTPTPSVTKVTSAEGRVEQYGISPTPTGGEQRTSVSAANLTTSLAEANTGAAVVTDPDGTITTAISSPDPRYGMASPVETLRTIALPSGLTYHRTMKRSVTLDATGHVTALKDVVNVNGRTSTSSFDVASRTLTLTSPAGRMNQAVFDALGHLVEARPPSVLPIDYTYDRGRPKQITQGTRAWIISYGPDGFVSEATDPFGHTQSFIRDAAGRPMTQTLEDGTSAIGYGYDADSNLTSLTTPSGDAHAMSYSPVNLEAVYSPPQDGLPEVRTFSEYNLDRQLKTVTRPDALQLAYGYDSGGRPKTLTIPTGQLVLGYDPQGRVDAATAPSGEAISYGYDGPLRRSSTWQGQVQGALSVGYDPDFRRSSIAPADGTALNLTYDADSLLAAVGPLQLPRDPASGHLTNRELGGVTETLGYDSFGDLATVAASFGATTLYALDVSTRDALGRIALKIETVDGITHTSSYAYTPRGELRSVLIDGTTSTRFTYDPDGNRLTRTSSAGTISASYDAQDRLLTYGNESFTYTANGELEKRTNSATGRVTTYQYDVLGNLTHVGLPDGRQIDYLIDGQNRRVGKLVDGVLVQAFIYDGALRPVAEFDGAGNLVQQFVYATHVNVPDYIIRVGALLLVLTDHLGSVRRVVDSASGAALETVEYDAWGSVVSDTQPGLQPFGFAGGLYDTDTLMARFGARDYDSRLGRWTTKDRLRVGATDANLYRYARGEPANHRDSTGLIVVGGDATASQLLASLAVTNAGAELLQYLQASPLIFTVFGERPIYGDPAGQFGLLPEEETICRVRPGDQTVRVLPGDALNEEEKVVTLGHELGHAALYNDYFLQQPGLPSFLQPFWNDPNDPGGMLPGPHAAWTAAVGPLFHPF